jgi:hypothetical protein
LYGLIATSFPCAVRSVFRPPAWSWFRSSGGLSQMQPSAVVVPSDPEAVSALPRAEGRSTDIVASKTKSSVTNRATLGCADPRILGSVTHACLLWCLRRKRIFGCHGRHIWRRCEVGPWSRSDLRDPAVQEQARVSRASAAARIRDCVGWPRFCSI